MKLSRLLSAFIGFEEYHDKAGVDSSDFSIVPVCARQQYRHYI